MLDQPRSTLDPNGSELTGISQSPQEFLHNLWSGVNYYLFVLQVLDGGEDFRFVAFNPAMASSSLMPVDQLRRKTIQWEISRVCRE